MIEGLPPEVQAPAAFSACVSPGQVIISDRVVRYALGLAPPDYVRVHIVDVFDPGDERAELLFHFDDGARARGDEALQAFVDFSVYRRAAAYLGGVEERAVVVPPRIAGWVLGMTVEQIAAYNAEVKAFSERADAQPKPHPDVIDLEERRRERAVRLDADGSPDSPAPRTG